MLLQEVIGVGSYGFREIEDAGYFVESFGEGEKLDRRHLFRVSCNCKSMCRSIKFHRLCFIIFHLPNVMEQRIKGIFLARYSEVCPFRMLKEDKVRLLLRSLSIFR